MAFTILSGCILVDFHLAGLHEPAACQMRLRKAARIGARGSVWETVDEHACYRAPAADCPGEATGPPIGTHSRRGRLANYRQHFCCAEAPCRPCRGDASQVRACVPRPT